MFWLRRSTSCDVGQRKTVGKSKIFVPQIASLCGPSDGSIHGLVLILLIFVLWLALLGCGNHEPLPATNMLAGSTMGTTYSIKVVPVPGVDMVDLNQRVQTELDRVNQQMSTYLESSELSIFNRTITPTQWVPVSIETVEVTQLSMEISTATQGAFDVTVGPLVNLWGFGPDGRPTKTPSDEQIKEARNAVGYSRLEVRQKEPALRKQHPDLQVDLSAVAKGHGVDRVVAILIDMGITNYFVEIGGEVRVGGERLGGGPWRVGIQNPTSGAVTPMLVLELNDGSLATSGNYRNFYEVDGKRYAHTIDPRSGLPVEDPIVSASVVAPDCASADAIATSMMCLGCQEGLVVANREGWAVLLMAQDQMDAPLELFASDAFQEQFPDVMSQVDLSLPTSE